MPPIEGELPPAEPAADEAVEAVEAVETAVEPGAEPDEA